MNQWESMNRRADELNRILNASKVNYSSPKVPQQPTLYEIQRQNTDELRKLREQFDESQKAQSKENKINRAIAIATLIATVISMTAAIIALIL